MKKFEILPPKLWQQQLEEWKKSLQSALYTLNEETKKMPQAKNIRIAKKGNSIQYYIDKKYIPKSQISLIKQIAQQNYIKKAQKSLKKEIQLISKFLKNSTQNDTSQIYQQMNKMRQELISPLTLTDQQYAQKWENINYVKKPISSTFITAKNEKVRSKSEVIIADTLNRMNIPYRYEYPVKLKNYTAHPDFYCLNIRTRQEYIWEHLGLLDNSEYLHANLQKLIDYQNSNYIIGKNLLITFETLQTPLTQKQIKKVITNSLK